MNKVTTCCKAGSQGENIYNKCGNLISSQNWCDKCGQPCTLEDISSHTESWEDRFDRQKTFIGIKDFIKSELEQRDRELIQLLKSKLTKIIFDKGQCDPMGKSYEGFRIKENAYVDIINIIKNNK
jgi:hypothetical protein